MNPRTLSCSGAELLKDAAVGELLNCWYRWIAELLKDAAVGELLNCWYRWIAELLKDAAVGKLLEAGIDES